MERPGIDRLRDVLRAKKYRIYDTPSVDWNLNLVGIRSRNPKPEKFDDLLTVFHRFRGVWDIAYYPITTDPSLHYLRRPIHPDGTAILKPGQYRGVYRLDIHGRGRPGAHKALCQRLGDVTVFRDANRDGRLDIDGAPEQTGRFGINLHRGPRNAGWEPANTLYSAGCQVFADDRHFAEFLQKCAHGAAAFGNRFTYTLLREQDLG